LVIPEENYANYGLGIFMEFMAFYFILLGFIFIILALFFSICLAYIRNLRIFTFNYHL